MHFRNSFLFIAGLSKDLLHHFPAPFTFVFLCVAPAIADQVLGRNGYDAQMTDEPAPLNRPNNLWEPLPGDHGAHGRFHAQARKRSWQLELDLHRGAALVAGLGVAAAIFALFQGPKIRQKRMVSGAQEQREIA